MPPVTTTYNHIDTAIVGAGPIGIELAVALKDLNYPWSDVIQVPLSSRPGERF